jgi:eukaryotic-like serine/threonine-protein kinase
VWSPDSERIAYAVQKVEGRDFHLTSVNGAGEVERVFQSDHLVSPGSWSPDGRFLIYTDTKLGAGNSNLWVLDLAEDRKASPFANASGWQFASQFSPDGRWVAYESQDSSGKREIFAQPFISPGTQGAGTASGRWQVSEAGGITPRWSSDGKEIYFINPLGEMMAVPIAVKGSALKPGRPVKLFQTRVLNGGAGVSPGRQYDVAPDGRFLINQVQETGSAPITLIENWNPDAGK